LIPDKPKAIVDWPPHITVATVIHRDGRYLMVEEFDHGRLVINQPAGHQEPGETLFEAAIRETLEETGWLVTLQNFIGVYQYFSPRNEVTYHRIAFTAGPVEQQKDYAIDPDIHAVHWMTLDEIRSRQHRSPLVVKCIVDAVEKPLLVLNAIQHM
jgi:8-oxo-dGTP pyrophosphatase MutT (NUDIX family)